jgi:hypothetical protein
MSKQASSVCLSGLPESEVCMVMVYILLCRKGLEIFFKMYETPSGNTP